MIKYIMTSITLMTILLAGCTNLAGTSDETSIQSARVFTPQLTAAENVDVRVFPVNDTTRIPVYSTSTNHAGEYSLPVSDGMYNVMIGDEHLAAFQDSVAIGDTYSTLHDDTLAGTATLLGSVTLEPSHDPRTITAQIMGTDRYANCTQAGTITISGLAAGEYVLRAVSTEDEYTPTYVTFTIDPAQSDTTRIIIDMIYTGIPTVRNLHVTYDTIQGNITLSWDPSDYFMLKEYLIYNNNSATTAGYTSPVASTTECSYSFPVTCSTTAAIPYYVAIRSKTLETGPVFETVEVTVQKPFTISLNDTTPLRINLPNPLHVSVDGYTGGVPLTYEWDVGATGIYHTSSGPDTLLTVPEDSLYKNIAVYVKVSTAGGIVRRDTIVRDISFLWEKIVNPVPTFNNEALPATVVLNDSLYAISDNGTIYRSCDAKNWNRIESDFKTQKDKISEPLQWTRMMSRPVIFNNQICLFDYVGNIWTSADGLHFDYTPSEACRGMIEPEKELSVPGVFVHAGRLYLQTCGYKSVDSLIVTDDLVNWEPCDFRVNAVVCDFREIKETTYLYGIYGTTVYFGFDGTTVSEYHYPTDYQSPPSDYRAPVEWSFSTFTPFHNYFLVMMANNVPLEMQTIKDGKTYSTPFPEYTPFRTLIEFKDTLYNISGAGVYRAEW